MGCFGDAAERAMGANGYYSHANMTIQMCVDKCSHDGYAFAGLEVGTECFCDNDYTRWGELPQSNCPTRCKGATDEVRHIIMLLFRMGSNFRDSHKPPAP